jgi:hypothetical protein
MLKEAHPSVGILAWVSAPLKASMSRQDVEKVRQFRLPV